MQSKSAIAARVLQHLSSAPVVGFSGSRSPSPASVNVARWAAIRCPVPVAVGDARGIDAVVRQVCRDAEVFRVERLVPSGFALRSIQCVHRVSLDTGLWCFFPSGPCPARAIPTSSSGLAFNGSGSGTWASAAFAGGCGCPLLCWCPSGVEVPRWGFEAIGRGWFYRPGSLATQGELFSEMALK